MIDERAYPTARFQSHRNLVTTFTVRLNKRDGTISISQTVNGHDGSQWVCLDIADVPGLLDAIHKVTPPEVLTGRRRRLTKRVAA